MLNVLVANKRVKTINQTVQTSNNQKAIYPTSNYEFKHINYNNHIKMQVQLNIKVE